MLYLKTACALVLLSTQSSHAARVTSKVEEALKTEAKESSRAELMSMIEKLEGSPCEYALGHEVKKFGINFAGGTSALTGVQDAINKVASTCHAINKVESEIAKEEEEKAALSDKLSTSAGELGKAKAAVKVYAISNKDVTDEVCKNAYWKTNLVSKASRQIVKGAGKMIDWIKNLRATEEEKAARAGERADAAAEKAAKLEKHAEMAGRCLERDGLDDQVSDVEKAMADMRKKQEKSGKRKVALEVRLGKEQQSLNQVSADAVKTIQEFAASATEGFQR
eukprot:TRINITY_DN402_c0_g1_i4.p1 TRINITY_DN402_c0_g1~~TRINITY_DN402_c0_g1_i4.p1  ORF type:complete len:280 (-),score=74.96 TRINITY_DN402_c0_g1_i4:793-1632(-)